MNKIKSLKLNILILSVCLLSEILVSSRVFADISRLRIAGLGGLAFSQIVGAGSGALDTQSPLGASAHVDYLINGQWEVGTEHLRTISIRNGTAVGFTGLSLKNYFWYSHPQTQITDSDSHGAALFKMQALIPYIGMSGGIVQASILDRNIGSLAAYVGGKGGVEYPISDLWGLRSESNLAITIYGSGQVSYFSILFGAYFYL